MTGPGEIVETPWVLDLSVVYIDRFHFEPLGEHPSTKVSDRKTVPIRFSATALSERGTFHCTCISQLIRCLILMSRKRWNSRPQSPTQSSRSVYGHLPCHLHALIPNLKL